MADNPNETPQSPAASTSSTESPSLAPEPECPRCGGLGFWSVSELNFSTGETRRVEYCDCQAAADAQRGAEERAAHVVWQRTGIPRRFLHCTLESSPWAVTRPEIVAQLKDSASSWFLHGPVGTGKTGLAVGYASEWVFGSGAEDVRFMPVPDLLTELRDTYNRREGGRSELDVLNECRDAELLILDDIGAEQVTNTGWLEDRLYQIIGHRHADDTATVFTSNLTLKELGKRIGERNIWRIAEMCKGRIVNLAGPNLRAQA